MSNKQTLQTPEIGNNPKLVSNGVLYTAKNVDLFMSTLC